MKKIKNAVFSILNVLVIAGILLFIIAGLMKIGMFEVPAFLRKFTEKPTEQTDGYTNNQSDFLGEADSEKNYEFQNALLTPDSVKKLLSELAPTEEYSQDVHFTVYSGESSVTKRVFLMKKKDLYCAFYLSGDSKPEKQIVRNENRTVINILDGENLKSAVYNNGDIDFSAQTGVILTHKDFFEAADNPQYTFSLKNDEHGTVLLIEFVSVKEGYSQLQKYTLNLDYGIVTEAKCYENDALIYEMYTDSISDNSTPGFAIPKEFMSYLPSGFMPDTDE